jgi:hypothetical protein
LWAALGAMVVGRQDEVEADQLLAACGDVLVELHHCLPAVTVSLFKRCR